MQLPTAGPGAPAREARRPPPAREALLAAAGLCAAAALFFPGILRGESFFYGDFHAAFQPLRSVLGRALRQGLPLWTPELGHGQPLAASPFAAALYPPSWLFALSEPESGRLLSLLTVLHLLWGAAGTWGLLRSRGASLPARWTGAFVFAFCGMAVSGSHMTLLCFTVAWSPWALLALDAAAADRPAPRRAAVLLLAWTVAVQVASGDPFILAATLLGVALHAVAGREDDPGAPRAAARRTLAAAGGTALGLLAASPLLVAASVWLSGTARGAGLAHGEVFLRSLHPLAALGLGFPGIFGDVFRLGPQGFLAPGIHDDVPPLFPSLYVGLLALFLAALGAFLGGRGGRTDGLWLAILLALALGRHVPGHELLLEVPGFAASRYPVKWLLAGMLPLALLSARGLDVAVARAARPGSARGFPAAFGAALLLPAGLVAAVLAGLDGPVAVAYASARLEGTSLPLSPAELRPLVASLLCDGALRAGLPLLGAALVVLLAARRGRPRLVAASLAGFVTLDVGLAGRSLAPTVPDDFYGVPPAAVSALRASPEPLARVWVDGSEEARRVRTVVPVSVGETASAIRLERERMPGYVGAAYGLALAFPTDLESLSPSTYAAYRRLVETAPPRERTLLLRMANVSHVVSPLDRGGPGMLRVRAFHVLAERPLGLWAVQAALPRVRTVEALRVHDGPSGLLAVLASEPDEFADRYGFVDRGVVPGAGSWLRPAGAGHAAGPKGARNAAVTADLPDRLAADVEGAAFLLVADAFGPGWRALVDGREAPLLPANLAFRAVPVPGGRRRVEIVYRPLF